ncbi:hypothetical protein LguiA_016545 [Lonicera macranthoides]
MTIRKPQFRYIYISHHFLHLRLSKNGGSGRRRVFPSSPLSLSFVFFLFFLFRFLISFSLSFFLLLFFYNFFNKKSS